MTTVSEKSAMQIEVNCDRHGLYTATVTGSGFLRYTSRCPACGEELDNALREREAQRKARERRELLARQRRDCAIPPLFTACTFDNFLAYGSEQGGVLTTVREYAEHFDPKNRSGANLALVGFPGTGKTHLASAIANDLLNRGCSVLYRKTYDLLRQIKNTWSRDSDVSETAVATAVHRADLLILDEVGMGHGSDTEKLLLFDILDTRYAALRPTVVVSNLDKAGLRMFLSDRLMDRLFAADSTVVRFGWKSYRQQAGK
jgi:DNA replication protein DnaC